MNRAKPLKLRRAANGTPICLCGIRPIEELPGYVHCEEHGLTVADAAKVPTGYIRCLNCDRVIKMSTFEVVGACIEFPKGEEIIMRDPPGKPLKV